MPAKAVSHTTTQIQLRWCADLDVDDEDQGGELGERRAERLQRGIARTIPYLEGDDCAGTRNGLVSGLRSRLVEARAAAKADRAKGCEAGGRYALVGVFQDSIRLIKVEGLFFVLAVEHDLLDRSLPAPVGRASVFFSRR